MKTAKQYLNEYYNRPSENIEGCVQRILDDAKKENVIPDQLAVICADLHQVRVELANLKLQIFDLKFSQSVQIVPPTIFPDPNFLTTTCSTPGVSSYHKNWSAQEEHQTAVDKFFASQNQPKQ